MSQTKVTKHYSFRKRNIQYVEGVKPLENIVSKESKVKNVLEKVKTPGIPRLKTDVKELQKKDAASTFIDKKGKIKQSALTKFFTYEVDKLKNAVATNTSDKNSASASAISLKDVAESEISSLTFSPKPNLPVSVISVRDVAQTELTLTCSPKRNLLKSVKDVAESEICAMMRSPKRNLTSPTDEGTPSKRKPLETSLTLEIEAVTTSKPKKSARRKLELESVSDESRTIVNLDSSKSKADIQSTSPKKSLLESPYNLDALIDSPRSTIAHSPKLDELKKPLRLKTGTLKECHSSPHTSTIPSSPTSISIQTEYLILPPNYKMLAEIFRNMDALVATLNNRKEKITFENVKESLQKIMKKNISEKHLGQIVTVYPSAYSLSREKARYVSQKNEYSLVIVPIISAEKCDNQKIYAFQPMTLTCLANRVNEFNNNLLDIVKGHHQDFLRKINFATISNDDIKQWHPKFPVDTVPNVPAAQLPELKVYLYTAKEVLNKIIGSFQPKVSKALHNDETEKSGVTEKKEEETSPKPKALNKALEGVPPDLLEKIRAKESAKHLKTMMETPEEKKKLAMMERALKWSKIVSYNFKSEGEKPLPIDAVVDNIILNEKLLLTPDDIKKHLELIAEKFPHWMKFIQYPKGLYLKINSKTNI